MDQENVVPDSYDNARGVDHLLARRGQCEVKRSRVAGAPWRSNADPHPFHPVGAARLLVVFHDKQPWAQDFLDFSNEDACVVLYTSEVMVEEEIEIEPTPRDELVEEEAPPKSDDGAADAEGEGPAPPEADAPADEQAQGSEGGADEGGEEGNAPEASTEAKAVAPPEPKYEKIWVSKKKLHLTDHHLPDHDDQIAYFLIRNRCCMLPTDSLHSNKQHGEGTVALTPQQRRCCMPPAVSYFNASAHKFVLLRYSIDPVPISESEDETHLLMTLHLETGLANASSLQMLEQVSFGFASRKAEGPIAGC